VGIFGYYLFLSVHGEGLWACNDWGPGGFSGGGGVKRPVCGTDCLCQLTPKAKKAWSLISTKVADVGPIVCCCDLPVPSLFCNLHKVYVNASVISRDVVR